jgi:hypothetical protein
MEQSWSTDQFSAYDYYGSTGVARSDYVGGQGSVSGLTQGQQLQGRMLPNGPAEMALAAAQRARERGISAEVWAPCDSNGRCLPYGAPDGPVTLRSEDYDRWSDNPPLTYQDRDKGIQARYNGLAQSEIQGARQRVVDPRHIEIPSYESLYAPANGPSRAVVSSTVPDGPQGRPRRESFSNDEQNASASGISQNSSLGLEVTKSGIFVSFELIIFFLFVMMLSIIIRQNSINASHISGGVHNNGNRMTKNI